MSMTVITAWNLLCKTDLHLLTALVCKRSHCKSLSKHPQNRRLPLDSALGKTSKAKIVVLPHVLAKRQQNLAILGLVAKLFLKISFLLKKVNNLQMQIHAPNPATCMMFWEVNQKPLPSLTTGYSFGYPARCRCPQRQIHRYKSKTKSTSKTKAPTSSRDDLSFMQGLALSGEIRAVQVQFPFPPLLLWSTQRPVNTNLRTGGSSPAVPTAPTEQGKGKGDQCSTQPHGFSYLPAAGVAPDAPLKEAYEHQRPCRLQQPLTVTTPGFALQPCKARSVPAQPPQLLTPALTGPRGTS